MGQKPVRRRARGWRVAPPRCAPSEASRLLIPGFFRKVLTFLLFGVCPADVGLAAHVAVLVDKVFAWDVWEGVPVRLNSLRFGVGFVMGKEEKKKLGGNIALSWHSVRHVEISCCRTESEATS